MVNVLFYRNEYTKKAIIETKLDLLKLDHCVYQVRYYSGTTGWDWRHWNSYHYKSSCNYLCIHAIHAFKFDVINRPDLGRSVTKVEVNLAIRSMGPVDETKQSFTLDCYFRQASCRSDNTVFLGLIFWRKIM